MSRPASTSSVRLTVVKCGGADDIEVDSVAGGVAALRRAGDRVALVHGGAREIARLAAELGVEEKELTSPEGLTSRYTDGALLDVVVLALLGRVKPRLLAALHRAGVPAVGLSGLDGGMLRARRKPARRAVIAGRTVVVRDDRSGRIESVDPSLLSALLDAGVVPVVSPPAVSANGASLNVDADRAAAAVAVGLGADRLLLLTAAPGVQADPADPSTVLAELTVQPGGSATSVLAAGAGMHRKLVAVAEALSGGVAEVRVSDGRVADPIRRALAGEGTRVVLGKGECG